MKRIKVLQVVAVFLVVWGCAMQHGLASDALKLTVKLRGVLDSKITLTPFDGVRFALPLDQKPGVKPGGEITFDVPVSLLPGEFLLRFDYRASEADQPYPAELQLYLNRENIRVEAHPLYLRGDSLRLINDVENTAWFAFENKSAKLRQQMGLLQQLLAQYNEPSSRVWKEAAKAYEKRRMSYNQWIDSLTHAHKKLYVSHLYPFQRLKAENWKADEKARLDAVAQSWFDDFNFGDTLALKSRQMNEFINGFMGLYGMRATTEPLRDSLFAEAGRLACAKASGGHPKVYGWMVDYFYNGFETYGITPGLEMLEAHINNPNCLTSKKVAITQRLEGIKKLVPGVKVPSFVVHNYDDREETIDMENCSKNYRLLVFYDSECGHCAELLGTLKKWYEVPENAVWLDVVSIALDRTREHWEPLFLKNNFPWTDLYAPGGVNSQVASDYYVLSTPYMYLLDRNGKLIGMPDTVENMNVMIFGK